MSVKIKTLRKKPTKERFCPICEKRKEMPIHDRFCSTACRQQATEIDRYSTEFKVALSSNKR